MSKSSRTCYREAAQLVLEANACILNAFVEFVIAAGVLLKKDQSVSGGSERCMDFS